MTENQYEQAARLYESGMTLAQVAAEMSICIATARSWAVHGGATMRPRGGPGGPGSRSKNPYSGPRATCRPRVQVKHRAIPSKTSVRKGGRDAAAEAMQGMMDRSLAAKNRPPLRQVPHDSILDPHTFAVYNSLREPWEGIADQIDDFRSFGLDGYADSLYCDSLRALGATDRKGA